METHNIHELLLKRKQNDKALSDAQKQDGVLKSALKAVYLTYHKQLIKAGFYENFNKNHYSNNVSPLKSLFSINEYNLPYRYACEGDYTCIHFQAKNGSLFLNYKSTFDNAKNRKLIEIPLELFEDENKLKNYVDSVIENNNKEIDALKAKEKEQKIQRLVNELNQLK